MEFREAACGPNRHAVAYHHCQTIADRHRQTFANHHLATMTPHLTSPRILIVKFLTQHQTRSSTMAAPEEIYQCQTVNCGYMYNPDKGDRKGKIPAGVKFEDLPEDWRCPICGGTKNASALAGPARPRTPDVNCPPKSESNQKKRVPAIIGRNALPVSPNIFKTPGRLASEIRSYPA